MSIDNHVERYEEINGLRLIACLGIVLMHIMANFDRALNAQYLEHVVGQFGNFVFLFMIISSFGMCCGYFEKIRCKQIDMTTFYSKRIKKILPFFIILIVAETLINFDIPSVIEGFANSTMLFNFLQKDITVIGVGWFLGLVFVYYIMFPYFVFLYSDKKRAWLTFVVSIAMNLASMYYFNVESANMFYSFTYFCLGGLIYLYRKKVISFFNKHKTVMIFLTMISIFTYFALPTDGYILTVKSTVLYSLLLCCSISYRTVILDNKFSKIIGNISFEIYLCHMAVFRLITKLHLTHAFDNPLLSYFFTAVMVISISVIVSYIFRKIYSILESWRHKNESTVSK